MRETRFGGVEPYEKPSAGEAHAIRIHCTILHLRLASHESAGRSLWMGVRFGKSLAVLQRPPQISFLVAPLKSQPYHTQMNSIRLTFPEAIMEVDGMAL